MREAGFTGGEPGTNYELDVGPDPDQLARLIELIYLSVYAEPADFAVGVRFRHGDVAQAFTAELQEPTALSRGYQRNLNGVGEIVTSTVQG